MLKIKELRTENKLTQKKLGELINKSNSTIHDWESGRAIPSIYDLITLSDYFKVSTDYLLGREDYGTGLINVQNELNKTELEMLEIFKRLTRDNQIRTLGYMSGLMKYQ